MPDAPQHRTCGTTEVHLAKLSSDPDYARARAAIDTHANEFARSGRAAERTGNTVIPVIVHVIYRAAADNISDAQINSQIDVLNKDYRQRNSDTSKTPDVYKPFAGDARIEFALASLDPNGRATTGITRTQTTVSRFYANDDMKYTAQGGHDAWDATRYLNIWVVPEIYRVGSNTSTILGYAYFPGIAAAIDGVTIAHPYFGTNGTAAAPFNLGRTATHEVGHWLNLKHLWGDGNDNANCTLDDDVADTPRQQGPNYLKPTFPRLSCNNGPNGDMFMNYMDYVDDDTMVMFSRGQIVRMQAALDGARSTLGAQAFAAKVDLVASAVVAQNAQFSPGPGMVYNSQYGGWMLLSTGSNFQVSFNLPSVPSTDVTLTLLHCTSSLWPKDGFSPVNIDVNNTSLRANFDPATAHRNTGADTRDYVRDQIVVPKSSLRTGANSVKLTMQPGAITHYWIRSLQLDA
jgi:hypothetical protein